MRRLAAAQLTNSIGDGAFYVTSALYFTRVVGLSATQVGLGLTIGWAAGFVAGVPLGHLADQRGPRTTSILLAIATAATISAFLVARSFWPFLLAVCLYTSAQCGLTGARQALLAGLVPAEQRTRIRAVIQAAVNGGIAIGAGLGGLALYFDTPTAYTVIFAVDAVSFLACAAILRPLPEVPPAPATGGKKLAVLRDRPYAVLALLNTVMLLHIPLITLATPLWIVQHTDAPRWMVSAILLLNTVSVVLFQVRVARGVTSLATAVRSMRHAGVMLLIACVVFALSALGTSAWLAAGILLAAALVQTYGEMMQAAGAWEISFALAPPDKHGQYQGLFGNGLAVARVIAPLLLTTLIVTWGIPGWIVLGAVFLITSLLIGPAVRWAERTRPTVTAEPQPATCAA
ncbi:MFS transporter [Kibdelosporangium phytohabitans]|uniref:MFS transporter n=1 Tax=Kibdelosporangium phytohabitans TaxID=860235 RepID=A0A0N9HS86_9PSEU|nr:MFS transporter [Kibdelosporangium phytohabitans]ALG10085.1 MFS transporter [Kibdelosporangium phytohabitans]MBE1461064.1 MFS family permease [Kibdelosporangium phytohabitans]